MEKPYPIDKKRIAKSRPFSSEESVLDALKKLKKGESIGFSRYNSLVAMGLVKNKNQVYQLSPKYK